MGYKNTYTLRERDKERGLQKQRDRSVTKTKREKKEKGEERGYKNKGTPLGYKITLLKSSAIVPSIP
tara:strand:+ start:2707 stop:2907 length:201 start_codon:yes stop_codon:yes gene_type:complete